jgi:hypothetical protein
VPGIHRQDDDRACQAKTQVTGQSSVYANGKLYAVEGDQEDHGGGALEARYGGKNVFAEGIRIIVGKMADKGGGDSALHPFAPTDPKGASENVFAYNGKIGKGNGIGSLSIGELVKIGGQVIGMVKGFTAGGGGSGQATIQNLSQTPQAGQTLTGEDSGQSFVLSDFTVSDSYDSEDGYDYSDVIDHMVVCDDGSAIAIDSYFTGKDSQDYQTEGIVVEA